MLWVGVSAKHSKLAKHETKGTAQKNDFRTFFTHLCTHYTLQRSNCSFKQCYDALEQKRRKDIGTRCLLSPLLMSSTEEMQEEERKSFLTKKEMKRETSTKMNGVPPPITSCARPCEDQQRIGRRQWQRGKGGENCSPTTVGEAGRQSSRRLARSSPPTRAPSNCDQSAGRSRRR